MIDILKNELSIAEFRRILRNYVPHKKIIHTEERKWDAFIFVLNGSCRYQFRDGTDFTAKAGDLFYLAKGSIYEMDVSAERYEVIFIDFLFSGDGARKSALLSSQYADRESVFRRMLHTYSAQEAGFKSRCLSELYRLYADLITAENTAYLPTVTQKKIEAARTYLLQNLSVCDLRQEEIAAHVGVSRVYLRRLFHKHYGASPNQFLTSERLRHACELMWNPDLTLEEIALQSGFSTLSYFCRVFKEKYGISPGVYRKSLSEEMIF